MNCDVLISGGGIAGLTLALKLVARGVRVTILEKYAREGIMYKGELLQPKSIEILAASGLLPDLMVSGYRISRTLIEEREHAGPPVSLDYGVLPSDYAFALMIPHDVLKQLVLTRAAQSGLLTVLKPAHLLSYDEKSGHAFFSHDGKQETLRAHFFVGAEGKFSTFRARLNIHCRKTNYNHQFLTVTVPRPAELRDATVVSRGDRFIGLFPLPDDQVRTVLLVREGELRALRRAGLPAFFRAYHELVPMMKGYVDQLENWKQIQLMIPLRQEAERYVSGRSAIIGDAAHSVHPMAGEGMNMAIQDADVLASLLAWMLQTGTTDEQTLRRYEAIRKPRAMFVAQVSHLSALAYSYRLPFVERMRTTVLRRIANSEYLLRQYMINISGLGMAGETLFDRALQLGLWPARRTVPNGLQTPVQWFSERTDYPWLF
jgi:2-polyprenyl-6-methoxyphenol hydroxylase-like FAD-dependent oxidoreductase